VTAAVQPLLDLPEPSHIGERLREARAAAGMTVREVAQRVGVSPSLISQIERNKVTPSVSTLWALVSVLGLSMGDLFDDGGERPDRSSAASRTTTSRLPHAPITAPGQRPVINLETGVTWERLTADPDQVVEFLTIAYAPGAESCDENSLLRHSGKEYGYVLRGVLGVRVGFDEYELHAGMAVSFDASSPHRLWAVGDQPAEALWVVVGRQSNPPYATDS
jgi:transcriptional regulator with XRE-family HTH domain